MDYGSDCDSVFNSVEESQKSSEKDVFQPHNESECIALPTEENARNGLSQLVSCLACSVKR